MNMKKTIYLTTTEAAERIGVKSSRVRQFILTGRLIAEKFGRDWRISETEVERFSKIKRTNGRPKDVQAQAARKVMIP